MKIATKPAANMLVIILAGASEIIRASIFHEVPNKFAVMTSLKKPSPLDNRVKRVM